MAKKIQTTLFVLFFSLTLLSNNPNLKFERISVEQGLSQEIVPSIIQDYQGYMWFGTRNGLNKYDGYKFTIYQHDPADTTSIGSNSIETLFEDRTGALWIGTLNGGLNRFDRKNETFKRYIFSPNTPDSIHSNTVFHITGFQYKGKDVLWIGAQNGLYKMDIASEKFKKYLPSDRGFPYNSIEAVVVDSSGIVWLGCTEGGLYKFNPETEQFANYLPEPHNPNSLSDNRVMSLYIDNSGLLWIGTFYSGLSKFDPQKEQFFHFQHDPDRPKSISGKFILSIYEDRNDVLWIGTAGAGLNRFDGEKEEFTHYQHDPGDQTSISDNTIMCGYEDRSGVLWIGTYGGINKIDPRKAQISHFKQMPGNSNSLTDSYVWAIYESSWKGKNQLWIGTKTGGLNKLDHKTGEFRHYSHDPKNPTSLPNNNILSLYEDQSGILWIGTYGGGIIKYNQETEEYTQYMCNRNNPKTISCDIINSIIEDSDGILWIATRTGGLNKFDRYTENFSQIGNRMHTWHMHEDKSGILWIATNQGLKKYDRHLEKFQTYLYDPENLNSINTEQINYVYESCLDDSDVLWIGTSGGGLNRFYRKTEIFNHFTVDDGLPDNVINGILEDDHGNLWLSTNNGLSRFNPVTQKFRNYNVNDGLLSNQFNLGACLKSINGEMLFGSTKGLIAFHPDSLLDNPHVPEIVITDFLLFNEPVKIEKKISAENEKFYKLPSAISQLQKIELTYKENIFSFEFSALDYRSPEKNQYAYLLEGLESDWNYTDYKRRFATYTNLDPGEYVFKVKGSNNDGLWNAEGASIKIIITPPWWRTNLAYSLFTILVIGMVLGIWRFQTSRLKMKHQLEMGHFEAEKLREVDHLKSRFFANISHEFRTPLTLIKGPIKQMLTREFKGDLDEQYRMILRYSDRLLHLINQILDLSKLESGYMKLQVSQIDILDFLKGLVQIFSSLAECKNITFKFKTPKESLLGYVDRDKLEKIVTNLLSNSFKFTPEEGRIEVAVLNPPVSPLMHKGGIKGGSEENVEIRISNTGPGILPNQLKRIFNRFYQVDKGYNKDSEGTGIGLALTKELVQACHGEIQVESEIDKITTFTVVLPIGKEYFKSEEIVEEVETEDQIPKIVKEVLQEEYSEDLSLSRIKDQASGIKLPLLLIIEDNLDVTRYISSFLEQEYRIISAENGEEGWKKAMQKFPDLIISDVMMPVMDGFELCYKLKSDEKTSHIPVILLTAKADIDSRIEGLEFGADDYISKPFDTRELQVRVNNLIEQRKKLREKFSKLIEIKPGEVTASSMDEQFLERLIEVSEKHLSESGYSTENFAREVGMSRSHLNRKLKALTDLSTHRFILNMRLKRAAQLLKKRTGTITEISYTVGFNNPAHFAKAFRNQYGQSPRDFTQKYNE